MAEKSNFIHIVHVVCIHFVIYTLFIVSVYFTKIKFGTYFLPFWIGDSSAMNKKEKYIFLGIFG